MEIGEFKNYHEAIKALPEEGVIDEFFLERYEGQLDVIGAAFKDKGGVHRVAVEDCDFDLLCRLPAIEFTKSAQKKLRKDQTDGITAELEIFRKCVLWPEWPVVERKLDQWPGLFNSVMNYLYKEAKANPEAVTGKKL